MSNAARCPQCGRKTKKRVATERYGPKATVDDYAMALYRTFHGEKDDGWKAHKPYKNDTVITAYRDAAEKAIAELRSRGIGRFYEGTSL